jgi:Zn-dependent protease
MIQVILFLLTVASTYLVGGVSYSVSIIAILLAHEMGHYFMSKRYGIPALELDPKDRSYINQILHPPPY